MSEEIKELQRKINNLEARVGGYDAQIKAFYDAMESIRTLAQSMAEVFSGGAPVSVQDKLVKVADVAKSVTWPVLESGKYVQSLTGIIVDDVVIREVQVRGKATPIANFNLTDGVTVVKIAIWDALVNEVKGLGKGDTVTLTGMSIKDPYEGVLQISSTRNTTIE